MFSSPRTVFFINPDEILKVVPPTRYFAAVSRLFHRPVPSHDPKARKDGRNFDGPLPSRLPKFTAVPADGTVCIPRNKEQNDDQSLTLT